MFSRFLREVPKGPKPSDQGADGPQGKEPAREKGASNSVGGQAGDGPATEANGEDVRHEPGAAQSASREDLPDVPDIEEGRCEASVDQASTEVDRAESVARDLHDLSPEVNDLQGHGATQEQLDTADDSNESMVGWSALADDALLPPGQTLPLESLPKLAGGSCKGRGRRLVRPEGRETHASFTSEQRILILDTWLRSGLPAKDFAGLVGISKHTLYAWKKRFTDHGPAGLMDQVQGAPRGSRVGEVARRAILMLKQAHPEWGCQRISDMLARGPALGASASAVSRVLHEAGYEKVEEPTRAHRDKVRRFERAKPNQLWLM